MSIMLRLYRNGISKYPYTSQAVQAGLLMGLGDGIAQKFVQKREDFDYRRCANFLLIGCFAGIGLRKWYGVLSNRFVSQNKKADTLKKLALDQMIFAPSFIAILIGSIGSLQGSTPKEIKTKLVREYPDLLIANYKLWPAVQLLNFYFIPLNYQVLLVQIVAVAWNTFVSFKTNQPSLEHIEENAGM